jgi:hypothetical protein
MNNLSDKQIFVLFILLESALIFILIENYGIPRLKSSDKNNCEIGIDSSDGIIQVLAIANWLDIQLFIAEPQRLFKYLNKQELELLEKSGYSFGIQKNLMPNKIILGVFESNLSTESEITVNKLIFIVFLYIFF